MQQPLIAPLAALAAGIAAARFVAFEPRPVAAAMAALAVLAIAARLRKEPRAALWACLAAAALGGILTAELHRPPPAPELDATARETVLVSGCIVEPPAFSEGREQLVLELAPGARARVSLFGNAGTPLPSLSYGQRVEMAVRVRRPHNFGNPGSFDYVGYLARKQVYWTASAGPRDEVKVLPGGCGSPIRRAIYSLRTAALDRIERLYAGKPYETGMMQAILIGETSRMEKVWTEHFRSTGTYHALVISGLHVTVLAGALLFLLRLCAVGAGPALLLACAGSWLYAVVTGWQAPVVRAAAGLTLFMAGRYFHRRRLLLNLVAAVAIGFLVLDPEQLFEASFQLTFLSVAAIAALAVPVIEATSGPLGKGVSGLEDTERDLHVSPRVAQFRVEMRLLAETLSLWTRIPLRWACRLLASILRITFYVFETVLVSATVQVGLVLPMAFYFHRVSLSGLSANVLVVPLISGTVPLAFLAVFSGWAVPAAAAGWLLAAARRVVDWHARWEPNWRVPDPPLWLALLFTASLVLLASIAVRKESRPPEESGEPQPFPLPPVAAEGPLGGEIRRAARRRAWAMAASGLVAALFSLILWHPFRVSIEPGALELSVVDVGQGECSLVVMPGGKLMLVDGGGFPALGNRRPAGLDIGEDVVSPYLWSRSIRRLDVLVASHGHGDHVGGLPAVLENFRPRELWTAAAAPPDAELGRLLERARELGVRVVRLRDGDRFSLGGAGIEVLAPPADYVAGERPGNNDSLVLRLSYGAHSFLLTGDIQREIEWQLLDGRRLPRTDVLKVAHHGSRTSSTEPFLERVRPAFAVISAGFENGFGNPHPEVLGRLRALRSTVLRTDLDGLVTIRTDGKRFRIETTRTSGNVPRRYRAF